MFQFFLSLLMASFVWLGIRIQNRIFFEARELVSLKHSLMKRDLNFLEEFCSRDEEEKFCQLTIKVRSAGGWHDICSLAQEFLRSRAKRTFFFRRKCRFVDRFMNAEVFVVL